MTTESSLTARSPNAQPGSLGFEGCTANPAPGLPKVSTKTGELQEESIGITQLPVISRHSPDPPA